MTIDPTKDCAIISLWRVARLGSDIMNLKLTPVARITAAAAGTLIAILATVSASQAATVYSYTGNDFVFITDSADIGGTYTTSMNVTGSLTLTNPLGPNEPLHDITGPNLQSFSFFDGRNTITNLSPNLFEATLQMGTGGSGEIGTWLIQLRLGDSITQELIFTSRTAADAGGINLCVNPPACSLFSTDLAQAQVVGDGRWVSSEVSATPLPAALPLFASGLGALGLTVWRRKKKAAALTA